MPYCSLGVCLRSLVNHILFVSIYVPEKLGIVFTITMLFYDVFKYSATLLPNCRIRLFAVYTHYLITIIIWTYLKALHTEYAREAYAVECVSRIKSILSIIVYAIYGAVCFQLTHFFCDDFENACTSSYYYHEIGITSHFKRYIMKQW